MKIDPVVHGNWRWDLVDFLQQVGDTEYLQQLLDWEASEVAAKEAVRPAKLDLGDE